MQTFLSRLLSIVLVLNQSIALAQTSQFDTLFIDFGSKPSPSPWINMDNPLMGDLSNLTNEAGVATPIGIRIVDPFHKINTNGTEQPAPNLGFPATATGDSFFGNTRKFSGQVEPTGAIELYNLPTNKRFQIFLFASRRANDNRQTTYIIKGADTDTLRLNASSNIGRTVSGTFAPASNGTLRITATAGRENNSEQGFYYLGAMKVVFREDPPKIPSLSLRTPKGGEYWQAGKSVQISWTSKNIDRVALDYSVDYGETWLPIDTVSASRGTYLWTVPPSPTLAAMVRVSGGTLSSSSPLPFEIATTTDSYRIVVIGSSTAEGQGVSTLDSSWVKRYANYLSYDTRFEVINLAKGGQSTYHVMPTGAPIPPRFNISVNEERNLTRALSLQPNAVILNMPSNDASYGVSVDTQLINFRLITDSLRANGADVWVTTTQPRRFKEPEKMQIQFAMRDSLLSIYKGKAINFWEGIADETGYVKKMYNSGDNVHLNDAAHRLLFNRILSSGIEKQALREFSAFRVQPDRNNRNWAVEFETPMTGLLEIHFTDGQGNPIKTENKVITNPGFQRFECTFDTTATGSKHHFCIVQFQTPSGTSARKVAPLLLRR